MATIESVLTEPSCVGATLAREWTAFFNEPRARYFDRPDPDLAGALVLFHPGNVGRELTAEERLLHTIFRGNLTVIAVSRDDRKAQIWRPDPPGASELPGAVLQAGADEEIWQELCRLTLRRDMPSRSDALTLDREPFRLTVTRLANLADVLLARTPRDRLPNRVSRPHLLLRNRELRLLRLARDQIARCLDRSLLTTMPSAVSQRLRVYNWLVDACTPDLLRQRIQAIHALPAFAELMARDAHSTEGVAGALTRVVDEGKPLIEAIALRLGVPQWVVRRVGRCPTHSLKTAGVLIEDVTMYLALTDPSKAPDTESAWRAFAHLCAQLEGLRLTIRDAVSDENFAEACRRFLRRSARYGWARALERLSAGFRYTGELCDFSTVLRVAEEETGKTGTSRLAHAVLGCGIDAVQSVSESWHRALQRHMAQIVLNQRTGPDWPALLPDLAFGNRIITALTSPTALAIEGSMLEHCVGTYTNRCLFESVHVLSLRDHAGHPCSTAEIILDAQGPRVVQHRGRRNSKPSAACRAAVRSLMDYLSRTETVDRESLAQALEARRQSSGLLIGNRQGDMTHASRLALAGVLQRFFPDHDGPTVQESVRKGFT